MSPQKELPSHLFVVFGATGDLARKKLLPAVARLGARGALPRGHAVLGVARSTEYDDDSFRAWARESLDEAEVGKEALERWCDQCLHYQAVGNDPEDYQRLARRIEELERELDLPGNRVFYLSIPPKAFPTVVDGLGRVGLHESRGFVRLVVEKPFGHDLDSAQELNRVVHRWFDEDDVFRIDHFLGKETVQNLLVFRFANQIFESLWNRNHIQDVQITVAESGGIDGRAGFYEGTGALRDMVQNHLTQILTHVAMEVPAAYDAASIHHEKRKVLKSTRPLLPDRVVFGRYEAGRVGDEEVRGYLQEEGVAPDSTTETYAALQLEIDSWRWQGVPFYLRTGKRMARRLTQIAVTFRRPPVQLFRSLQCRDVEHDVLVITLQPDEGFSLHFDVKRPGTPMRLEKIPLSFRYGERFGELPEAYTTLLEDVLQGDSTLFVHAEEVEGSWALYDPVLREDLRVHPYEAGSWGPRRADELPARNGHLWRVR